MLRLRDAANAAGITVAQLQYYCLVGLIQPAARSSGRQRLFDSKNIKKIRMIRLLNDSGYTLRDIRQIFVQKPKNRSGPARTTSSKR